jgi:hypothetical protein
MDPRLDHFWRILSRDSADGNDGQGGFRHGLFQEVKPARRACVFLGSREIDRAEADIIRAFQETLRGLFHVTCRPTDDGPLPQEVPGKGDREIILPEMNTIGMRSDSHVHPVIHNKGYASVLAQGLYLLSNADHLPCLPTLLAKLDRIRPAGNGKLSELQMGESGLKAGVREHVESSNLFQFLSPDRRSLALFKARLSA